MNTYALILIFAAVAFAAVAFAAWFFVFRKKKDGKLPAKIKDNLAVKFPDALPFIYDEPNMPFISSVVGVPVRVRENVRSGIQKQIDTVKYYFPEWQNGMKVSDYNVMFIAPDKTNEDGSPALMAYGKYQTAGTVIGIGGDGFPKATIVLPHQADSDWKFVEYLFNSAWFESEHFCEAVNSESEMRRYEGANDVHPHRQPVDAIQGFRSKATVQCAFGVKK